VPHVIEPATSGRAKCRGCDQPIAKDELRFGERLPNAFGEGEMTLWFHLPCAAYTRPAPFLEASTAPGVDEAAAALQPAARFGLEHRRVPRIHGAERASTGRARCRQCRESIGKGEWRIPLVFFEEHRFEPGGFIHAGCAQPYFDTTDVVDRLRHFSPALDATDLADLAQTLDAVRTPTQ
jgi:Poly(ADP-ribose) polymerase and DNA-Ligase Zn-finger region